MQVSRTLTVGAFHPKYRMYKKLRNDIWGTLAFLNKKNKFYRTMRKYAHFQLFRRIRRLKFRKRKYLFRVFRSKKRRKMNISVNKKTEIRLKKPLKFRSSLQILRKKLLAFYGLRKRRKPQRKLFLKINKTVNRNKYLLMHNNRFTLPVVSKNAPNAFETRLDVILYRASFIEKVPQGRRVVRERKAS